MRILVSSFCLILLLTAKAGAFLPDDCAIVATEATERVAKTGCWTRIVWIVFLDHGRICQHAVAVWEPRTTNKLFVYDQYLIHGTITLPIVTHDPQMIANQLMTQLHVLIFAVAFW